MYVYRSGKRYVVVRMQIPASIAFSLQHNGNFERICYNERSMRDSLLTGRLRGVKPLLDLNSPSSPQGEEGRMINQSFNETFDYLDIDL